MYYSLIKSPIMPFRNTEGRFTLVILMLCAVLGCLFQGCGDKSIRVESSTKKQVYKVREITTNNTYVIQTDSGYVRGDTLLYSYKYVEFGEKIKRIRVVVL